MSYGIDGKGQQAHWEKIKATRSKAVKLPTAFRKPSGPVVIKPRPGK